MESFLWKFLFEIFWVPKFWSPKFFHLWSFAFKNFASFLKIQVRLRNLSRITLLPFMVHSRSVKWILQCTWKRRFLIRSLALVTSGRFLLLSANFQCPCSFFVRINKNFVCSSVWLLIIFCRFVIAGGARKRVIKPPSKHRCQRQWKTGTLRIWKNRAISTKNPFSSMNRTWRNRTWSKLSMASTTLVSRRAP